MSMTWSERWERWNYRGRHRGKVIRHVIDTLGTPWPGDNSPRYFCDDRIVITTPMASSIGAPYHWRELNRNGFCIFLPDHTLVYQGWWKQGEWWYVHTNHPGRWEEYLYTLCVRADTVVRERREEAEAAARQRARAQEAARLRRYDPIDDTNWFKDLN